MAVLIEDSILQKADMTSQELLVELAVYLYDKEILSFGKAKELANMDVLIFQKELAWRNVFLKYDGKDLELDLKSIEFYKKNKDSQQPIF
jgi:predicted HTH domain antitoxin